MFCSGGISGKAWSDHQVSSHQLEHAHTHTHTPRLRLRAQIPWPTSRRRILRQSQSSWRASQSEYAPHAARCSSNSRVCDAIVFRSKGKLRERLTWPRGSLVACVGDHYFRTVVVTLDGAANGLLEVHGNCLSFFFSEVAMCILAQSMHASFGKLVIIDYLRLLAVPGAWLARPGRHTRHCAQSTTHRTFATCAPLAGRNSPRSK
jgi:hypothetical protein